MINYIDKNFYLNSGHVDDTSLDHPVIKPLVVVLMCTYNGEPFLAEQLNSLEAQTHQNWILIVSDDGSRDATLDILLKYQEKWPRGKMVIRNGPQKGFCRNFLSLACDPDIQGDYFAFSDQDDLWLPEKLDVALRVIAVNQKPHAPFIYCGRTLNVDNELKPCGMSPLFVFPPSFRNALVQSIAGGNTMVFNLAAKLLIEKAGPVNVPSHDWWVYQLISGVDGDVFYDPVPYLLYRQHQDALVGGNNSVLAKLGRLIMLWRGDFRNWNTQNIAALMRVNHLLAKNHQEILKTFTLLRDAGLKDRLNLMQICGLYRQTRLGRIGLLLAILLNRI